MSFWEKIESWDQALFLELNSHHNPFFDTVMEWVSYPPMWIPFYVLLLYFVYRKYGWKGVGVAVVAAAAMIAATDQTTNLFKNVLVERFRPCHNLDIQHLVHIVGDHCGGKHGFFSGHTSNHFATATFIGLLLRNRKILWGLWVWAALVAYSRIYLGVHYPLDLLGGMICGLLYGFLFARLYFYAARKFKISGV